MRFKGYENGKHTTHASACMFLICLLNVVGFVVIVLFALFLSSAGSSWCIYIDWDCLRNTLQHSSFSIIMRCSRHCLFCSATPCCGNAFCVDTLLFCPFVFPEIVWTGIWFCILAPQDSKNNNINKNEHTHTHTRTLTHSRAQNQNIQTSGNCDPRKQT